MPLDVNTWVICLIPKVECPKCLTQFCPISLCNVIVKIVSKILANRLQLVMSAVTGPFQSSFIPGRLASDNVVVIHEMVHSLRKLKGRTADTVMKINLEKAYDRVDWTFMREVLTVTSFAKEFQEFIMNIVTSTSLRVYWNGELLDAFAPLRGLR